ncbi:serine arginine-rich splicing factor [Coemansia sp. RSA 2599]|nr:serine arginine-rich splicing factor [Coemansia sp. RSA 2598]KAJ1829236.1 serine arginine-rich splicing factor [Coemansia sp. RSA 2599]
MSRLYVGHLPRDVRERDIERLFKDYGPIRDICLLSGFGFVEFRDRRDAEDVMHDFNNREFMGERLLIEPARVDRNRDRDRERDRFGGGRFGGREERGRGGRMGSVSAPQRTPFRVLVENLSSSVSWQDLKDFARRAGEVSFADAHKLRHGEGIVEFADESGMRNALRKLDGEDLRGRRVLIREDPGARSGGGGGGRGRREHSPSPRRSRGRRMSRSRSPAYGGGHRGSRRSYSRSPSPVGQMRRMPRRSLSRSRSPRSPRSPRGDRHDGGGDVRMAPMDRSSRSLSRSPEPNHYGGSDIDGEHPADVDQAPEPISASSMDGPADNAGGNDGWE